MSLMNNWLGNRLLSRLKVKGKGKFYNIPLIKTRKSSRVMVLFFL